METEVIDRAVRLREVEQITGLSKSTIYRCESEGKFPKRIKLTERASAWRLSEIRAWMNSR